jgi:hypothetical protein
VVPAKGGILQKKRKRAVYILLSLVVFLSSIHSCSFVLCGFILATSLQLFMYNNQFFAEILLVCGWPIEFDSSLHLSLCKTVPVL